MDVILMSHSVPQATPKIQQTLNKYLTSKRMYDLIRIMTNGEVSLPLLPFVVDQEIFLAYFIGVS
jgi:hypothetical protein